MTSLEAKAASDKVQPGGDFDSAEWRAWMKRELRRVNQKARRMLKKLEGGKRK